MRPVPRGEARSVARFPALPPGTCISSAFCAAPRGRPGSAGLSAPHRAISSPHVLPWTPGHFPAETASSDGMVALAWHSNPLRPPPCPPGLAAAAGLQRFSTRGVWCVVSYLTWLFWLVWAGDYYQIVCNLDYC